MKRHQTISQESAFTLVEMLVVISLGLIILITAIVSAAKQKIVARNKVRVADIQNMRLAIEEYKLHCGEYPNKIELTIDNGCHHGEKLGDFLAEIPKDTRNTPLVGFYGNSRIAPDNNYFYAGLSTEQGGKCYDYHIAAAIENPQKLGASYLKQDHDAEVNTGKYKDTCAGSNKDFGKLGNADDVQGLYDFRSDSSF